jgi:hypothetical protein
LPHNNPNFLYILKEEEMKAFKISALALAALAFSQTFAGCPSGSCGLKKENQVQGRYGTYNEYTSRRLTQVGQITEPMLLNQLDKQGRRQYFGLDEQGRKRALDLANSGKFSDKNEAVAAAASQTSEQLQQDSVKRLQNGMKE